MNKTFYLLLIVLLLIPGSLYFQKPKTFEAIENTPLDLKSKDIISNSSIIPEEDRENITSTKIQKSANFNSDLNSQTNVNPSLRVDYQSKNNTVKSLDYVNNKLFSYSSQFGTGGSGNGQFQIANSIAIDQTGNMYVSDGSPNRVQKFDSSGNYLLQWGTFGTGNGQFNSPRGIAIDSSGDLFVADYVNDRVQKFDSSGNYLSQFGTSGIGNGQLDAPYGITIDSQDNIFITEDKNHRVQKFDSSGNYLLKWGSFGTGNGQFNSPFGIAIDSQDNVYVAGIVNNRVQKFDENGNFLLKFGTFGTGNGQFDEANAVAIDSTGNIYVTDRHNDRVQKFDSSGNYVLLWGSFGAGNGELNEPYGIGIDYFDNIFVVERGGNRVQKFSFESQAIETSSLLPISIDSNDFIIDTVFFSDNISRTITLGFTYFDMINPESLGINFSWETKKSATFTSVFNDSEELTLDISKNSIYSANELKVDFRFVYSSEGFTVEMSTFDTGLNQFVSSSVTSTVSFFEFKNSIIKIDYIWAESQHISSNIRSELQYGDADQKIHTLDIDVFDYRIPLAIYSPMAWNLTSITPSASYTWDDANKYWYIANTVPTTYSIIFQSGPGWGVDYPRQSNIVALNDISSEYLQSSGLESGEIIGLGYNHPDSTYTLENLEIKTDIVSGGSFSLFLENTVGSTGGGYWFNELDEGEYYISYDYYLTAIGSGGSFRFDAFTDTWTGGWRNSPNDILNRWHKDFFSFDTKGTFSTYTNLELFVFTDTELYIDNFKIWKASGQQSNLELSEYEFSSQFIYWDGYQNPVATNIDIEWSLRERTVDTKIISKSLKTDSSGLVSYNFKGGLDIKEYESRWFSWDSYFFNSQVAENNKVISSQRASTTYWYDTQPSEVVTFDTQEEAININNAVTNAIHDIRYQPLNNWDLKDADYWLLTMKEDTISGAPYIDYWTLRTASSDMFIWHEANYFETTDNAPLSTSYQRYGFGMSEYSSIAGNANLSSIDYLDFRLRSSITHILDNLKISEHRFIQAQKNYFTPIPSSYDPSYYTQKQESNNYVDFTESVDEGCNFIGNSASEVSQQINGYWEIQENQSGSTIRCDYDFDADYYDSVIFRMYSNITASFYLRNYALNTIISATYNLVIGWNTYTIPLIVSGMVEGYGYRMNNPAHTTKLDYMIPIHIDTITLYETEDYFYLDSENSTLGYNIQHDTLNYTVFDEEIIWKNQTLGSHQIDYQAIFSIDPEESRYEFLQLPTSFYSYFYQVINDLDDLAIEGLKAPEYDIDIGLLSFFFSTNWENTTITVYQNDSSIGSNIEGINSVFTFTNTYGSWNFTYVIDGGSESFVFEEWVSINSPDIEKTLIHFRLANEAGVGLDFITAKILVNNAAITAADRYYLPGTILNISIYSWTNELILNSTVLVKNLEHDITLIVPIIEQEFNNKNDFDVLINLKSTSNTNYSISYVVSSDSSLIVEMFAGKFTATYTPLDPPNGDNGTHILTYSSITQALEIRKGLSAVNVITSLTATKNEVVEISYFEKYILGPMLVVFGTLSLIGIFVALIFYGFRSLLANIIRENLLEPGAQQVGRTTGTYDLSDDDDISLNRRKLSYKNKHI